MKIKKSVGLFILTAMLVLSFGCKKDFLNPQDTTDATKQSLFKSPADAISLVSGIYNMYRTNQVNYIMKGIWYEANFLSQDYVNWGSDVFFTTYEMPTNWGGFSTLWNQSYKGIASANSALPIINQMKTEKILSDSLANRLTGEIYFLRGSFYYYLGTVFGGVPLELNAITNGLHPRSSQDSVFASVEADMKSAAALLPWQENLAPADIGRATKGAALAYMGSAQMWQKKYSDAVASFNQLQGHYQLEQNFIDIHDFNNQNGKEDIFSIQFQTQADMRNASTNTWFMQTLFDLPNEIAGTGYAYADKRLYDSFEPGDSRKYASVIGPGDEHPDPKIQISKYPRVIQNFGGMNTCGTIANPWKGPDFERSGYYNVKFWRDPNVQSTTSWINSSQNAIMLRYGEVLISEAEALSKSGNESAARDIINNQIRNRARLGPAPAGEDFTEILLSEYQHELAGEFSLYFDLRRAGQATHYVKEKYGIDIPEGHELMPIPQDQIAVNPLLIQNPGY